MEQTFLISGELLADHNAALARTLDKMGHEIDMLKQEKKMLSAELRAAHGALAQSCDKTVDQDALLLLTQKLAALTRSMQQIANLDPDSFNSSQRAVQMAKTALLIPINK